MKAVRSFPVLEYLINEDDVILSHNKVENLDIMT